MQRNLSRVVGAAMIAFATVGAFGASAGVPGAEHPRPDMLRENWLSLNGPWQFENDKDADGEARGLTYGTDLKGAIIVPFCPESSLSGLGLGNTEKLKNVWYRRTFEVPAAMKGMRVRIHFGGVDYQAWVYINGQLAGTHIGENVEFSFDITAFLKDGANEVVVKVLDDMWSGLQPCGKQCGDQSYSCFYTRTTGIWQSVWLEAVGSSFVEQKLRAITSRRAAYERNEPMSPPPAVKVVHARWRVLLGAMQDGALCTPYRYVAEKPADDWAQAGFDDKAWTTGLAAFGSGGPRVRTEWKTQDIYLRNTFEYDGGEFTHGGLVISHDEDTEVYVNGQKILEVKGFIGHYELHVVTDELKKALKKGANTIAVHTHQTWGGQYIDLALLVE
jgi:hypothetical protein